MHEKGRVAVVTLYVLQGPDKGRRYDLPTDEQVPLGRASDTVPLTDLTVSRRHAMLERRKDGWILFDEGSSNGVFVNGVRIVKSAKVNVGDQIRLGSTLMVFGSPSQTVTVAEPGAVVPGLGGRPALTDSSIVQTVSSSEDSIVLAAPEPSAAAMTHFRALLQVANAINSVFDTDALLNKVLDVVFDQLRADRAFVGLANGDHGKVTPTVVRYRDEEHVGRIAVSQTIIQHVLSKNEGVLSSDATTDQRFSKGKSVHSMSIRSAICVPIKGREKIHGVIHLDTMVANFTYTPDQLRLMTAIGLQTGMAMDNLRLYRENLQRERLAATGETVASLSHSIKNILQGISSGADVIELALKKGSLDNVKTGWRMLSRNLDKVQGLTMNMLAYSKSRTPHLELIHLPHVINEVVELVRPTAHDRKIILLTEIDDSQPPAPVDTDGLHQAILNLVVNAVDAVEPEQGVVTVSSKFDPVANEAVIEVEDNGTGISADQAEKIFLPFYSTKGQRGTGLGLAVTRKIVEEHEGRIQVESELGRGTTFRIRLPMTHKNLAGPEQTHGPR